MHRVLGLYSLYRARLPRQEARHDPQEVALAPSHLAVVNSHAVLVLNIRALLAHGALHVALGQLGAPAARGAAVARISAIVQVALEARIVLPNAKRV